MDMITDWFMNVSSCSDKCADHDKNMGNKSNLNVNLNQ